MDRAPLTLVSFPSLGYGQSLGARLRMHGFVVRDLSPDAWLEAKPAAAPDPLVLLFDKSPPAIEPVQKAVASYRQPVLGMLGADCDVWDAPIVHEFTDFAHWPCSDRELVWRLDRLLVPPSVPAPPDGAVRDALLQLNIVGQSPVFLAAVSVLDRLANADAPVLIEGETGTGKELVARAVHYLGTRRDAPFVPVNCGAIPDNLLENELFGHERGAYTDAQNSQPGLVALAEGGTLFLDEIDALSPKAQVALLRFLQDRQFRPLGSKGYRRADVRIVTATNTNLDQQVSAQKFRQDLLFRLNILAVRLPSLRERVGDIETLSRHFMQRFSHRYGQPGKYLHPSALAELARRSWPGNVRELENVVHQAFLLSDTDAVRLPPEPSTPDRRHACADRRLGALLECNLRNAKDQVVADFEHRYLQALLDAAGGNISEAARRAGKERRALGKLVKKYNLRTGPASGRKPD